MAVIRIPIGAAKTYSCSVNVSFTAPGGYSAAGAPLNGRWACRIWGFLYGGTWIDSTSPSGTPIYQNFLPGGAAMGSSTTNTLVVSMQVQDTWEIDTGGSIAPRHKRVYVGSPTCNGVAQDVSAFDYSINNVDLDVIAESFGMSGSVSITDMSFGGTQFDTTGFEALSWTALAYDATLGTDTSVAANARIDYIEGVSGRSGTANYVVGGGPGHTAGGTLRTFPGAVGKPFASYLYASGDSAHNANQLRQVLTCVVRTALVQQVSVTRWPDGAAVPGLALQRTKLFGAVGYGGVPTGATLTSNAVVDTGTTDVSGNVSFAAVSGDEYNSSALYTQLYTGSFAYPADLDALALGNAYIRFSDPIGTSRWYSDTVQSLGNLINITRTTQATIDPCTSAASWTGEAFDLLNPAQDINSGFNQPSVAAHWVIGTSGTGITAQFPTANDPGNVSLGVYVGVTDNGKRRAFRLFRKLRIRINAATGTVAPVTRTIRVVLQSVAPSAGPTGYLGIAYAIWAPTINPGENVIELDMSNGPSGPFHVGSGYSDSIAIDATTVLHQGGTPTLANWDQVGAWQVPDLVTASAALTGDYWRCASGRYLRIEGLKSGVAYTIEEVTVHDGVATSETPFSVITGTNGVLCLCNGRPFASLPGPTFTNTCDQWITQFNDYIDGGGGNCVATSANAVSSSLPPGFLRAGVVSETAAALNGELRASKNSGIIIEKGYDQTVGVLRSRMEFGMALIGLLFSKTAKVTIGGYSDRDNGSGHSVEVKTQYPPPGDAASPAGLQVEATVAADADGYWMFNHVRELPYLGTTSSLRSTYNGSGVYYTPHQFDSVDDPVATQSYGQQLQDRTWSIWVILSAFLSVQRKEIDLAQCRATGQIIKVWSDPITNALTSEVRWGWAGLSGTAARMAGAITDSVGTSKIGLYPSLWIDSFVGKSSIAYQRVSDGLIVLADSLDHMRTVGAESVAIFTGTGGYPCQIKDPATGITLVVAAFPNGSNQDLIAARLDSQNTILHWSDGSSQKTFVVNTAYAGRPAMARSHYDGAQTVLLMHGDRRFQSADGGETWAEVF